MFVIFYDGKRSRSLPWFGARKSYGPAEQYGPLTRAFFPNDSLIQYVPRTFDNFDELDRLIQRAEEK